MQPLVSFDTVSKRYDSRAVIDQLSFSVPEGSVTALLGPNGAGKTTAMRLLLGIARGDGGSISLLGAAPGGGGFHDAVRRTGALVEEPALYANASAESNMRIQAASLGMSDHDPRIGALLGQVGLSARASDRVKKYSLGMRQRLGLALALVNVPQLVILDEPTNGLDPAGVVEIRELIRSLPAQGTTVLVSSHLLAEVQKTADRAVIIDGGRLVSEGPIADLMADAQQDTGYLVRVPREQHPAAVGALQTAGYTVAVEPDGALLVSGEIDRGARVAYALSTAGVLPDELRPRAADLETAFLNITGGNVAAAGAAAEDSIGVGGSDAIGGATDGATGTTP
ncbi:MAG: ATP-binding cassette domain-containing protein [Actinobacteria bacterium]|nr:ATP-binding cassette domain-containing protein [Actinomycetota bacterium]